MVSANVTSTKQREILLHRAWEWAAQIEDANARACLHENPSAVFEPWDVHDLALALAQLASCLVCIDQVGAPAKITTAASAFKKAWADTPVLARDRYGKPLTIAGNPTLRELRNVFEHEADYIVGKGRSPGLVSSDWDGEGPGMVTSSDGIDTFWIFGISYSLTEAIAAALECKKTLELVLGTPTHPLPLASE